MDVRIQIQDVNTCEDLKNSKSRSTNATLDCNSHAMVLPRDLEQAHEGVLGVLVFAQHDVKAEHAQVPSPVIHVFH